MSAIRYVTAAALPEFLAGLSQQTGGEGPTRVLVPVRRGRAVVFAPYAPGEGFTLERATVSPKEIVLPRCETLLSYKRAKDPNHPDHATLSVDDTPQAQPTVLVGGRPCDARGFAILDRPYTQGTFTDPYYQARRACLTVITLTCDTGCATCFCHWMGSGPADSEGSDVLMTAVKAEDRADVYVLEAVTEKGEALLAETGLPEGTAYMDAALNARRAALDGMPPAPELGAVPEALAARFADTDFWEQQTALCLSCGACTYMCPTCYCFNITDEGEGLGKQTGRRIRSWDTCMSSLFTREASGHNPRLAKTLRMRNRISHKFSNYPITWNGVFSCNGCGRCIRHCPVHLDIRAIVLAAIQDQGVYKS